MARRALNLQSLLRQRWSGSMTMTRLRLEVHPGLACGEAVRQICSEQPRTAGPSTQREKQRQQKKGSRDAGNSLRLACRGLVEVTAAQEVSCRKSDLAWVPLCCSSVVCDRGEGEKHCLGRHDL